MAGTKLLNFSVRDLLWLTAVCALSVALWQTRNREEQLKQDIESLQNVATGLLKDVFDSRYGFQIVTNMVTTKLKAIQDERRSKGYDDLPMYRKPGDKFYEMNGKIVRFVHHWGDHITIQWEDGSADGIDPTDFVEHVRGPNESDNYYAARLTASHKLITAVQEWNKGE